MPLLRGRKLHFLHRGSSADRVDSVHGIVIVCTVFTAHLLCSMMTRCAGVLYLSWKNEFGSSASQTGAIASIMSSFSYFAAVLAGIACNRWGCRTTWILGGFMMFVSSLLSFWAFQLYQMYIIGAFLGTGVALCFISSSIAVAQYYKKYYAIAMGFTTAGTSSGMIVFPPLFRLLLDTYGWRGTMLITAGLSANICVVGAFYHPPYTERRRRIKQPEPDEQLEVSQTDNESIRMEIHPKSHEHAGRLDQKKGRSLLTLASSLASELGLNLVRRSYRFTLFCLIGMQFNIAYSCFVVFLVPRAQLCGIDEQKAPFLLSLFGFCGLGARVGSGFFVTRKIPVEVTYTISIILICVAALCTQAETYVAFAASACIVGVGTGANKAMFMVLLRKIVGLSNMASGCGISYMFGGIGDLLGPIFAGMLYDKTGNFTAVFYVLAGLVAASALQMLLLPLLGKIEPGLKEKEDQPAEV
ncbi:monocarboxylate transporter 12-like isoform X2 [Patiria miniata]|nr:monocarboxylate transporter 12-like isoform X2 [Patiria miniata]